MRDETYDLLKFLRKFLWGWTTSKLFLIRQEMAKQGWIQVKKFWITRPKLFFIKQR